MAEAPKAKSTREMIVQAAFEMARQEGAECINARSVAQRLGCSTQPVMYHFKTISLLKEAAYQRADEFHSDYIAQPHSDDPMKDIGLNYIRFAAEEKNLFRFLFQSDAFSGSTILDLIESGELRPVIGILSKEADITEEQAKAVFHAVFLCVHGYASILANNELICNEESISADLELILIGAIGALKGETT